MRTDRRRRPSPLSPHDGENSTPDGGKRVRNDRLFSAGHRIFRLDQPPSFVAGRSTQAVLNYLGEDLQVAAALADHVPQPLDPGLGVRDVDLVYQVPAARRGGERVGLAD